jgi:heme/copper-type cytochrome/quinol oxidase subunit 4
MRYEVISYFLVGIFSVFASINLSRDKISNDSATIIFFIFTIGPFVALLALFLYMKLKPN